MTRTRYKIFDTTRPYFLTCTVVAWIPVFTRRETTQILVDSWQFLRAEGRLELFGYVILENHVHIIARAEDLSREVGDFKSYTARQIIDLLQAKRVRMILDQLKFYKARHKTGATYQLWQEGSHPEEIQNEEMMWQKLEYIHNNPVQRGYVDSPLHWRYSSARNYAGLAALVPVTTDW
jgi:REP element-mobilizing transposase RayT